MFFLSRMAGHSFGNIHAAWMKEKEMMVTATIITRPALSLVKVRLKRCAWLKSLPDPRLIRL